LDNTDIVSEILRRRRQHRGSAFSMCTAKIVYVVYTCDGANEVSEEKDVLIQAEGWRVLCPIAFKVLLFFLVFPTAERKQRVQVSTFK